MGLSSSRSTSPGDEAAQRAEPVSLSMSPPASTSEFSVLAIIC
ncbi:hypothetical protein CyaNS01_02748 [Cyanobium sp. NS01]|nr:hypothetical protein CyaNS01_02748 [Cyanobium sp. NS01]